MQIKKEVLIKRIQKRLDKLAVEEQNYRASFGPWLQKKLEWEEKYIQVIRNTVSWEDYSEKVVAFESANLLPRTAYWDTRFEEDTRKRLKRNLEILEAIEGDTMEIEKLKTSRQFGIEELFGDIE